MSRLLQRARAVDARRPLVWDVGLPLAVAAVSVNATGGVRPSTLAGVLLVHGALVARRRHPLGALLVASLGVVLGTAGALLTGDGAPWTHLAVWLLLFHVGLRERGRNAVVLASAVVVLSVVSVLLAPTGADVADTADRLRAAVAAFAMGTTASLLGMQIRAQRDTVLAQREEAARSAVVAERSRIAQEMHDIIGHNLSVITSLANGGAVAARTSPDDAAQAFEAIGAVSRSSVRDVARVLSVLRHDHSADGASLTPQPALADVAHLVESTRAAGVPVTMTHHGDLMGLSVARQLAVYRIVQESLTNVLRHASRGVGARLSLERDGDDVLVTVDDDGVPSPEAREDRGPSSGQGILGMRERVEAFGGSLEAGPTGRGWRVRARIPAGAHEEL